MEDVRKAYRITLENLNGSYNLGDLGIYGRIILKCILRKYCEDVNWIHLAQDMVQ
jgi:hypothetical protein